MIKVVCKSTYPKLSVPFPHVCKDTFNKYIMWISDRYFITEVAKFDKYDEWACGDIRRKCTEEELELYLKIEVYKRLDRI